MLSLATVTTRSTTREGLQAAVGTVICSSVVLADVIDAVSPSTVTVLLDAVALKPEPVIVAAAPSVQVPVIASTAGPAQLTVISAVPLAESEVAVIVVVPLPTEVTRPADETVATVVSEDAHVTVAPDISVPASSFTVTLNVTVSPMVVKVFVLGDTVTVDATWLTVTDAVALSEPDVAVIVAVPSATEVTRPAVDTVATDAADVAHVMAAPLITLSFASLTVAVS